MNSLKRQMTFEFKLMNKPEGLLVVLLILELFFRFLILFSGILGYKVFVFLEVFGSAACFLLFAYLMMIRFGEQGIIFLFYSQRYLPIPRKDSLLGKYALFFLYAFVHNLFNLLFFPPAKGIAQGSLTWFHLFAEIMVSFSVAVICGGMAFLAVSVFGLLLSVFTLPALFFYAMAVNDWIEQAHTGTFLINLFILPILILVFFFITLRVYRRVN